MSVTYAGAYVQRRKISPKLIIKKSDGTTIISLH